MAFRSLVINSRCKLEYSLNFIIVNKGDEVKRILLDEIKLIIINTLQVSVTAALINECINKKIKICFSDEKHNLVGELVPYKNNFYANRRIKEQINFLQERKDFLRQQIIKEKIKNQASNIKKINNKELFELLDQYMNDVEMSDSTNREGLAAKSYFRGLFGSGFTRENEFYKENIYLNYGYSIILSTFNRSIKSLGYYTELGIHHIGETNTFNLSCDFMEPLRPLVDLIIINNEVNEDNFKEKMISMLAKEVIYKDRKIFLDNAIEEYTEDLLNFLKDGDIEKINFIKYEL